ncbi:MAG TPA: methyltransferase domain-containing protein [Chthonomonadaceae bacterium]|nr:methyltransferase domain-containing protein [Chthonomonadaceae bacterium]
MARHRDSQSPKPEEVADHYASGYEADRLHTGEGQLDRARTRELLLRFLPPAPATILDVGGGPGSHACWLARQGYKVHLIDITPLHVQMAEEASRRQPEAPLAGASIGDACALSWEAATVDAILLFGPLYHLTDREDRLQALREAYRVLKPGGVLLAVGISRFASTLDGLRHGYLKDPQFAEIVYQDLHNGQHRNPTGKLEYFMDTFFHHPNELRAEVSEAGFKVTGVYGVEGPGWILSDFENWWDHAEYRERFLRIARALETEPCLIGASAHLIVVAAR